MAHDDDPFNELKSTGALVLLIGAVIGGVLGATAWGSGSAVAAATLCAAAATSFVLSVAWFVVEGRRSEQAAAAELPFPSWLRDEADA